MKVLVLWCDETNPTTSVLDKKDVKVFGKKVRGRWDRKWYDIKVIAENDDEEWLSSLPVSKDGEILKQCSGSNKELAEKRQILRDKREIIKNQKVSIHNINNKIITGRSIFDDSQNIEDENNKLGSSESAAINPIKDGEVAPAESIQSGTEKRSIPVSKSCYLCKDCPEDGTYEEKFLAISESALLHLQNLKQQFGKQAASTNDIFLDPEMNIAVNRYKMNDFLRFSKGDPKSLTRNLLRELIGEERLSQMTATTIPKDIFSCIERYVNKFVHKSKIISLSEFKRCITLFCGSLKNKYANKTKTIKKENENNLDKEQINESIDKNLDEKSNRTVSRERTKARSCSLDTVYQRATSKSRSRSPIINKSSNRKVSKERTRSSSRSTGRSRSRSSNICISNRNRNRISPEERSERNERSKSKSIDNKSVISRSSRSKSRYRKDKKESKSKSYDENDFDKENIKERNEKDTDKRSNRNVSKERTRSCSLDSKYSRSTGRSRNSSPNIYKSNKNRNRISPEERSERKERSKSKSCNENDFDKEHMKERNGKDIDKRSNRNVSSERTRSCSLDTKYRRSAGRSRSRSPNINKSRHRKDKKKSKKSKKRHGSKSRDDDRKRRRRS